MKGKFITIEGTEGVGKSTNIATIEKWFTASGIDFLSTREPGGTSLGEEIRQLLLSHRSEKIDAMAELLLIYAGRAQHINEKIVPALEAGTWVLCDRFTDATYAYQGYGRGLKEELITALADMVHGQLQPDLTMLLDIDPKIGLARIKKRRSPDRFEKEEQAFFDRVRQGYYAQITKNSGRYCLIDASQSPAQVAGNIQTCLDNFVAK
jgi:dTMP kinase